MTKTEDFERYEFLMSPDYVEHWTIHEALRELFQNAIDAQKNGFLFSYGFEERTLTIKTDGFNLPIETMLLGSSTKSNDADSIGQFGEGYKLALLVLTRLGHQCTIVTQDSWWVPKFVKKKNFSSEIFATDVTKREEPGDEPCTVFRVYGIDESTFSMYKSSNPALSYPENFIRGSNGNLLLDAQYAGKVFVEGLYVTTHGDLKYGYDFASHALPLDRDRQRVYGYDLLIETAKLLSSIPEEEYQILMPLMSSENSDARYLDCFASSIPSFLEQVWDTFVSRFGNSIPVNNESTRRELRQNYKNVHTVVIDQIEYELVCKSQGYKNRIMELEETPKITAKIILMDWYKKNRDLIPKAVASKFINDILPLADNWEIRE